MDVPVYESALSTYKRQLVLISGRDVSSMNSTNQIWSSENGTNWQTSLPPLSTHHNSPRVVNTGNPEYLVVVSSVTIPFRVHILVGEIWLTVPQPLPRYLKTQDITYHAGTLYFISAYSGCYSNLQTLIESCALTGTETQNLWTPFPLPIGDRIRNLQSIQDQLICMCNSKIYAYSPLSPDWVHVADTPRPHALSCSLVLPDGSVVVFLSDYKTPNVFRATLRGTLDLRIA